MTVRHTRRSAARLRRSSQFDALIWMRVLLHSCCYFCGFLLCVSVQATQVYKDTERGGAARYADTPFPGSEVYEVPPLPTYTPSKTADFSPDSNQSELDRGYEALRITNIQNGEPIRANNGNVTVKLAVKPALKATTGHRIVVLVDGQPTRQSKTSTVELVNLDRGRHTLEAMIVDDSGRDLIRSERVAFYVKRVSVLLPNR